MQRLQWIKALAGVILIISFSACSKQGTRKGGHNQNVTPTGDLNKLKDVANNFNRVQRLAGKQQANLNSVSEHTENRLFVTSSNVTSASTQSKNPEQQIASALEQCQIQFEEPQIDPNDPFNFSFSMDITGVHCPISAKYYLASTVSLDSGTLSQKFDVKLEILDPSLAEINDISAASFSGSVTGKSDGNDEGVIKGITVGTITSKKYGLIRIDGSINGNGNNQSAKIVSHLNFTIQGEVTQLAQTETIIKNQSTKTYSFNGVPTSKENFTQFIKQLGILGQGLTLDLNTETQEQADPISDPISDEPDQGEDSVYTPFPAH